jgi:hypothetical protein
VFVSNALQEFSKRIVMNWPVGALMVEFAAIIKTEKTGVPPSGT